jgi:hypothetical protein
MQTPSTSVRRVARVAVEHPYRTVFAFAFAARAITALFIWAVLDGSVYEDDGFYTTMAIQAARGRTGSWDEYTHWLFNHTSTMMIPLTALYRVAGTSSLPGQLAIAIVGATVAVLGARLVARVAGDSGALAVGLLIALLPSQVLLSSVTLKDAPVWAILLGLSLLVARAPESSGAAALLVPTGVAGLLVLLAHLRLHTCVTASIALFVASVIMCRRRTSVRTVGVLAAALVTPWLLGLGPLGMSFVADNTGSIGAIRSSNARGNAAIAAATTTTTTIPHSANTPVAATTPSVADTGGGKTDIGYLPHGIFALLLEPLPWRHDSLSQRLAALETIVWYPMLVLAAIGLVQSVRRRLETVVFPIVVGGGTLVMWGLIEGNIGTAYRHRGEFAWVVCILAVLGGSHVACRVRCRLQTS